MRHDNLADACPLWARGGWRLGWLHNVIVGVCAATASLAGVAAPLREKAGTFRNWDAYGGPPGETHFSDLTQINDRTVKNLGLAWSIDLPTTLNSVATPLAVD